MLSGSGAALVADALVLVGAAVSEVVECGHERTKKFRTVSGGSVKCLDCGSPLEEHGVLIVSHDDQGWHVIGCYCSPDAMRTVDDFNEHLRTSPPTGSAR